MNQPTNSEALYVRAWSDKKRERLSLSIDESCGRVRRVFAAWVRAGRVGPMPPTEAE